MTWEDLLQRDDVIGGRLESQESGYMYRRLIAGIEMKDGKVWLSFNKAVRFSSKSASWEKCEIKRLSIEVKHSKPLELESGKIFFNLPYLGCATIFTKGWIQTDSAGEAF